MISVIIPIYRSHTTIVRALNSIRDAASVTNVDSEIVLVFDGPDHDSLNAITDWAPPSTRSLNIVKLTHGGIPRARNAGLRASQGDLVTFLDADDEVTAERFTAITQWRPKSLLIGCQKVLGVDVPGLHTSLATQDQTPYITSMIGSRDEFLQLGGFSEDFTLGDDWDLVIRAREAGISVIFSDEVWAVRHVSDSNASHNTAFLARDHLAAIRSHHRRVHSKEGGPSDSGTSD